MKKTLLLFWLSLCLTSVLDAREVPFDPKEVLSALQGNYCVLKRTFCLWYDDDKASGGQILASKEWEEVHCLFRLIEEEKEITGFLPSFIEDDRGKRFDTSVMRKKFLAQTYVAAAFLLALLDPKEIIAIPKDLRKDDDVFGCKMKDVPLNSQRELSEAIYYEHPDLAFVAHYTSLTTRKALQQQGISLFDIDRLMTIEEIRNSLEKVGFVVRKPFHARLLSLFIKASLNVLDHYQDVINSYLLDKKIIFLDYHGQFELITPKNLCVQLLHRLRKGSYSNLEGDSSYWRLPISKEEIFTINPDIIFVFSDIASTTLLKEKAFQKVKAIEQQKVFILDERLQFSPTQYLVMAYHDIIINLRQSGFVCP